MMSEADNSVKSGAVAGEAKGGGCRLEVENYERKLGWCTEYVVGVNH
jgi:hypothetical protein